MTMTTTSATTSATPPATAQCATTLAAPHALAAAEVLRVWEWGQGQYAPERALTLLAAATPEVPRAALAAWSIGRRNVRLLALRRALFGDTLALYAECPACGERLECALDMAALAADAADGTAGDEAETPVAVTVEAEEYTVRARLPDSRDLAALAACGDVVAARALLLRRCVVEARRAGGVVASDTLPEAVIARVVARLAEHEPLADPRLALECPACAQRWEAELDIAAVLWSEIGARARRLLREVHTLARAYGWREADILALGDARRQAYLTLVG